MSIFSVPNPEAPVGPAGSRGPTGTGDFGSVYTNGGSNFQVPGAAFVKLVGVFNSNGLVQGGGVTADAANDRLVINTTGAYVLWIMVAVTAVAGGVLSIQARRNGIALPDVAGQHTVSSTPLFGGARGKGPVNLVVGDAIEVYGFTNTGNTITYTASQLYARRLA